MDKKLDQKVDKMGEAKMLVRKVNKLLDKEASVDGISVYGKAGLQVDCLDNKKVCGNEEDDQKNE